MARVTVMDAVEATDVVTEMGTTSEIDKNVASGGRSTRRTLGQRPRGRSAKVVEGVMRSVLEELGRVGYSALKIEDVAVASGVNKTTIYRRWSTKLDLVDAALRTVVDTTILPDKGTVREDLVLLLEHGVQIALSPAGRGVIRVLQSEGAHPEVAEISRKLRSDHRAARRTLIERGMARGELSPSIDAGLLVEIMNATLYTRLNNNESIDRAFIEKVVDVVLAGAHTTAT